MALAQQPEQVLLFLGLMYCDKTQAQAALEEFCKVFNCTVSSQVEHHSFSDISRYYDSEMGGAVYKSYYLFESPIGREQLADIKVTTNRIEEAFQSAGHRSINLDPGYVSKEKFVLASAKDFAHRIYIGQGIFAEVTLHFTEKGPRFFSWTYEDYKDEAVQRLLLDGRARLRSLS